MKISVRQQISSKVIISDRMHFTFSVYPASTPIYMELVKNGVVADLMEAGTVVKQHFAVRVSGRNTPANNAFSSVIQRKLPEP